MSNQTHVRLDDSIRVLYSLLDIIPSPEQETNYFYLISPSLLLTIYDTYKNPLNPLDFINFNLENSIKLARGPGVYPILSILVDKHSIRRL